MPKTARKGPPVRGLCPAGHVVDTVAAKGRVTWRGACTHELEPGKPCGLLVVCKRVPGAHDDPPASPLEPAPAGKSAKSIRKVAGYVNNEPDPDHPADPGYESPPTDPPAAADEPDGGNPGVRVPTSASTDDGSPDPGGDHDDQGDRPRGLRRWWGGRPRSTGEWDDEREGWTAPGIFR